MRRSDDAHVGLDRRASADRGVFALPAAPAEAASAPPSACRRSRRGTACRPRPARKRPCGARLAPGEGALLVAEQLALDELARDRRHVDGDERARCGACRNRCSARATQLLAGAGSAGDHDREVGLRQARRARDRSPASPASDRSSGSSSLSTSGTAGADADLRLGQRPPDDRDQLAADRTASADIRRRHCSAAVIAVISVFCALMTMIGRSGRNFLMRAMRSKAFSSGHHHIGDDDDRPRPDNPAPQRGGVAGRTRR